MFPEQTCTRPGALPRETTDALPGSEEKIRVMIERAGRREQLFHPLDGHGSKGWSRTESLPGAPRWPLGPAKEQAEVPVPLEMETMDFEDDADIDLEEVLPVQTAQPA